MAKTISFTSNVRLFGQNFANRDEKRFSKMETFQSGKPIQVETLYQCVANKSFDFTLDGFKYSEISPALIEVIA